MHCTIDRIELEKGKPTKWDKHHTHFGSLPGNILPTIAKRYGTKKDKHSF